MKTTSTSTHKEQSPSWANVIRAKTKPPDIIRKDKYKYVPISLFKTTTGNNPLKRKIACLGGTSLKLGIPMKEFNNNIEDFVENIPIQLGEIQTCFEIEIRRQFYF
ncbi:hypothetical protein AYI69_g8963 [Smittium culicis]|uniref:Uncharacterized protein n=1 Tax=Smittium culicis TaxID=133412 RepID=A0A1R1XG00_9FUNG|nr:hypothetical protein AYI69_g8963 [Smittium culicis]